MSFLWSAMFAIRASVFRETPACSTRICATPKRSTTAGVSAIITGCGSRAPCARRMGHDRELPTLLRKLFQRGRLRVPLYARQRRFAQG